MRVLIAHNRYSSAHPSGENEVVASEAQQLRDAGVDVELFLRSSEEIELMSPVRKVLVGGAPIYSGSSHQRLARVLRDRRPDVVHLHNPYPLLSPWVVRAAHALGIPVVQSVHNFRHVCISGNHFRNGAPCDRCAGRRAPWPAVQHACYRGSRLQTVPMAVAMVAHRGTWRSVERFLAISPLIAEHLAADGVERRRITVKPNAVPDPGVAAGSGHGFLFAGRLTPEKGLSLLLDAWRRHPVGSLGTLRVLGDGPLRPLVQAAAAERADVEWVGHVPGDEVARHLAAAAVVLVPSVWPEPFGLVAVEALAVGRPVLATRCGNLPAIVGGEAQGAGWLVEPTVRDLADALVVAHRDAGRYGPGARARYESTFAPDAVISALLDIYRDVSGSARPLGVDRPAVPVLDR
ncbi:MAG: glycosyltransferase [Acidimicrobiales bacterium]